MAKCNQLTSLPFKGLNLSNAAYTFVMCKQKLLTYLLAIQDLNGSSLAGPKCAKMQLLKTLNFENVLGRCPQILAEGYDFPL